MFAATSAASAPLVPSKPATLQPTVGSVPLVPQSAPAPAVTPSVGPPAATPAAQIAWWKMTLQTEGILLPGPSLQLGFKTDFRPPRGRIGIYFGNLGGGALSISACAVAMSDGSSGGLTITAAAGPTALPPRGQALMMVQLEHASPFGPAVPALTVTLAGAVGGGAGGAHKLPVAPHRFVQPWPLQTADSYFGWWRTAGLAERQASFAWAGPYDRMRAKQQLAAGAGLAVLENVDPTPSNLVGAGYLATLASAAPPDKVANASTAIFCLLRLEVNPQRGAARLTVRSRHAPLADSLVKAFAAAFGNVAAPIP
nr:alpha adaptin ear domain protein [Emiliania huxleyi]